jgi:hypothetical protein
MADQAPDDANDPSRTATVPSGPAPRLRNRGFVVVTDPARPAPKVAAVRRLLRELGVADDLLDAPTLRRLRKAGVGLVSAADDDASVLHRLARDPVAAYRSVDPDVADALARVRDALAEARIDPPDIGETTSRRPRPTPRPTIRSGPADRSVADARNLLFAWLGADPARRRRLAERPEDVVDEVAPNLGPAARARLLDSLGPAHDDEEACQ